jgi:hypothetical protein
LLPGLIMNELVYSCNPLGKDLSGVLHPDRKLKMGSRICEFVSSLVNRDIIRKAGADANMQSSRGVFEAPSTYQPVWKWEWVWKRLC